MLENNYFSTRKIVTLAILAGLGTPLMFIELAPIPIAPFVRLPFACPRSWGRAWSRAYICKA